MTTIQSCKLFTTRTTFLLSFFIILISISACNSSFAQKAQVTKSNQTKKLLTEKQGEQLKELLKQFPDNTQFSVGIYDQGATQRFGLIHRVDAAERIPNSNHAFEVGSISKVFTSLMLSEAVVNKKVKLDDPVQDYLPFQLKLNKKENKNFTLQSLANHTSGLPRLPSNLFLVAGMKAAVDPYANYTEKYLWMAMQIEKFLEQQPATKYSYSNYGAGLLGHLLAGVYKEEHGGSYEGNLQSMIVDPYGLKNTTTDIDLVKDIFVQGLKPDGDSAMNWSFQCLAGAGAVLSTVDDLLIIAEKAIEPGEREKLMQKVSTELRPLGLAWHIDDGYFWHNGGTGGYTSMLIFDPEKKRAIVILTNVSAFHAKSSEVTNLAFELIKK